MNPTDLCKLLLHYLTNPIMNHLQYWIVYWFLSRLCLFPDSSNSLNQEIQFLILQCYRLSAHWSIRQPYLLSSQSCRHLEEASEPSEIYYAVGIQVNFCMVETEYHLCSDWLKQTVNFLHWIRAHPYQLDNTWVNHQNTSQKTLFSDPYSLI